MSEQSRRQRALSIFDELAELEGAPREARLLDLCAGDEALLAQVRSLLAADAATSDPFGGAQGWSEALAPAADGGHDRLIGSTLGPWRVVGVLGRGGMGAVYAVERSDGAYAQQAALKLIRGGADSPAARERFLRERQILAGLRHPNIATLLDGGISADGEPYFVMERVEGAPIDRWCDARGLGLRERVVLFLQVLEAVRHAHRNLVIHRDLKPSNLLVDGEGRVKLLDFGIAKQLEPTGLEQGDATATHDRALTFEYASPEQLHDAPITTATDVWQLGVVLHRLLSGAHPFGLTRDTPVASQLQRLERDPEPLARAAAHAAPEQAAMRGGLSPAALARALCGSLADIVQACLRREPEQRYASADALANDLKAWLDDRPINAVKLSRGERAKLWLKRNRALAAAIGAVSIALLAGTGVALWQAREAREQARIAERESASARASLDFLTDTLAAAAPDQAMNTEVSVRQLLDKARMHLDQKRLPADVRQSMQRLLGRLYHSLGATGTAADLLGKGLAGNPDAAPDATLVMADDLHEYASALGELERGKDAIAAAGRSVALRQRLAPGDPLQRLLADNTLATAYYHAGESDKATAHWNTALAQADRVSNPPLDIVSNIYQTLAATHREAHEFPLALALADRGLAFMDRQKLPAASPLRVGLLRMRSATMRDLGEVAASEPVIRQAIALQEAAAGKTGVVMSTLYTELALTLAKLGRYRESVDWLERADALHKDAGIGAENTAINITNRALSWEMAGDYAKSARLLEQALQILREAGIEGDAPRYRTTELSYANTLSLAGRFDEARPRLDRLRGRAIALDGKDSFEYAMATWYQVQYALLVRDPAHGLEFLDEAMTLWPPLVGDKHVVYALEHRWRGQFAQMQGDLPLAERELRAALDRQQADKASPVAMGQTRVLLADVLAGRGDTVAAKRELAAALPLLREATLPTQIGRAGAESLARKLGVAP